MASYILFKFLFYFRRGVGIDVGCRREEKLMRNKVCGSAMT
jgi:hypothetical protein